MNFKKKPFLCPTNFDPLTLYGTESVTIEKFKKMPKGKC